MDSQIEIFRPLPEDSPQAMEAFCHDCARKIHDTETIAHRYGFGDKTGLKSWLSDHPVVFRKIKELRAIWESDANVEVRARTLAGYATIESIPTMTQIILNPDVAPGVRNDSFATMAKIGGVASPPPAPKDGSGNNGVPGGRFSVQIVFASTGQVESFTTREPPVIEMEEEAS